MLAPRSAPPLSSAAWTAAGSTSCTAIVVREEKRESRARFGSRTGARRRGALRCYCYRFASVRLDACATLPPPHPPPSCHTHHRTIRVLDLRHAHGLSHSHAEASESRSGVAPASAPAPCSRVRRAGACAPPLGPSAARGCANAARGPRATARAATRCSQTAPACRLSTVSPCASAAPPWRGRCSRQTPPP